MGVDNPMRAVSPAKFLTRTSATQVFKHFGVPRADAELAATCSAKSDLRGIDSHGVARLAYLFRNAGAGQNQSEAKD